MSKKYANYINNEWVAPSSCAYIDNINPANAHELIGAFPESNAADAEQAIVAAATAQPGWAALTAQARGEFLRKAADILESRLNDVATDLMREEGKSLPEAKGETMRAIIILRYFSGQTMLPDGDVIPSITSGTMLYSKRVPIGVTALITPWNFPVAIPVWKAAPALAFGNTVVLKPSELAPMTAFHLAECFHDAGMPKGVFNVLFGTGKGVGETLLSHPGVSAISFTGSVKTGKLIAAGAVEHGKKYQLEMGGKNAALILDDANLETAINLTIQGAYKSAGQKCTATSRAIIHKSVYNEVRDRLVAQTKSLKIGPGDDSAAYLGPVISSEAKAKIIAAVSRAKDAGATVLCGGDSKDPALANGYFVEPIVIEGADSSSPIWREEVFGPVLCLMPADNLDDAIALLNDVDFGLSASIFTRSLDAAMTFADRAQAGMVRINGETAGVEPQAPFGGMKQSSSWSREQGLAAREFYTQVKTVSIDRAN